MGSESKTRLGWNVVTVAVPPCRNSYYGEQWASLMHRELNEWIAEHTGQLHNQDSTSPAEVAPEVDDGEEIISLRHPSPQARISNVVEIVPEM